MRPCMKCRKEFEPEYRFNTFCRKCKDSNKKTARVIHDPSQMKLLRKSVGSI